MENASKALIMAGSILVGVLIISLAAYLFNTFAQYGKEHADAIAQKHMDNFNSNFLKYQGTEIIDIDDEEYERPVLATAHNIITLANLARQNNINQEVVDYVPSANGLSEKDAHYRYIAVVVKKEGSKGLETWTESQKNDFKKKGTDIITIDGKSYNRYYKCTDIKMSGISGYVYRIEFEELSDTEYKKLVHEEL